MMFEGKATVRILLSSAIKWGLLVGFDRFPTESVVLGCFIVQLTVMHP